MNHPYRSKTFQHLLRSYFMIFIVPFIFLCLFVTIYYHNYTQTTEQRNIDSILINVPYIYNDLSAYQKAFSNVSSQLVYYDLVNESYTPKQPTSAMLLQKKLNKYLNAQSYFTDIWYYYLGDDYLFSAVSSNSVDFFTNSHYQINGETGTGLTDVLPVSQSLGTVHAYDLIARQEVVLFIYPVQEVYQETCAYIIFVCPQKSFTNSLDVLFTQNDGCATLYDASGAVICRYSSENAATCEEAAPENAVESADAQSSYIIGDIQIRITSQGYGQYRNMVQAESDRGWRIVAFIHNDNPDFAQPIIWLLGSVFIILVLGIAIIFIITKKNYVPIASIKDYLQEFVSDLSPQTDNTDDYEYIFSCIDHIKYDARHRLQNIYDFVTLSLVLGKFSGEAEFNELAAAFNLPPLEPKCIIVTLVPNKERSRKNDISALAKEVRRKMGSLCAGRYTVYVTGHPVADRSRASAAGWVICVLSCSAADDDGEKLITALRELQTGLICPTIIGLGSWCDGLSHIPVSYLQSVIACNRSLFSPEDDSIGCHSRMDRTVFLPGAVSSIIHYIELGNVHRVRELLEPFIKQVKEGSWPVADVRGYIHRILHVCADHMESLGDIRGFLEHMEAFLLWDRSEYDALIEPLSLLSRILGIQREGDPGEGEENLYINMQKYVKANCCDPTFSISSMAVHFSMTVPAISKFFKAHSSKTLNDIVTEYKIAKASNLLVCSDMSIQEIGLSVGYYNTSSFIRRFRQLVGVTPGEFKKQKP